MLKRVAKCSRCGREPAPNALYCQYCGQAVAVAAPEPQPAPPWLVRNARRYVALGAVLLSPFLLFIACIVASNADEPGILALAVSIVLAALPAVFFARVVVWLDRNEREPMLVLLGAFFWGALVATTAGILLNGTVELLAAGAVGDEHMVTLLTAWLGAPVTEELAKGAALLLLFIFARDEFDGVLDGIVYGGLVGIGFAFTENVLYFLHGYAEGRFVGIGELFYLRAILGGLNHAAFTAFTGVGFGWARENGSRFWLVAGPVVGLALAMAGHALWNIVGASVVTTLAKDAPTLPFLLIVMPLDVLALIGPGIVALLVLVGTAWRREARIIREQLRDEVLNGVLSEAEYERLCSTRSRLAA
ncbi:MAG: PrsW family glutamic-type intramembrane protease [Chloroflexota bacterium]